MLHWKNNSDLEFEKTEVTDTGAKTTDLLLDRAPQSRWLHNYSSSFNDVKRTADFAYVKVILHTHTHSYTWSYRFLTGCEVTSMFRRRFSSYLKSLDTLYEYFCVECVHIVYKITSQRLTGFCFQLFTFHVFYFQVILFCKMFENVTFFFLLWRNHLAE